MWDTMLPALRRLPSGPLGREHLLTDDFKLAAEGRLAVYWIPFERLNAHARLIICGLTPGFAQMQAAFTAARQALGNGLELDEILARVYRSAAFAGAMRTNLVRMLDELGVATTLGIDSTEDLFARQDKLVHATSALRYPVFVAGRNYSGSPGVGRSARLRTYVRGTLGPELAAVSDALIIPLGKAAGECVTMLVQAGQLDGARCLLGFPHPSGGNGHRVRQFRENKTQLRQELERWAVSRHGTGRSIQAVH